MVHMSSLDAGVRAGVAEWNFARLQARERTGVR
jgi:hypothetical protein